MKVPSPFLALIQFATLAALSSGCSTTGFSGKNPLPLKPFASDGCSFFPDGTPSDKTKWRQCCVEHDREYWRGGTKIERQKADNIFEQCVCEESGNARLAKTVHDTVRIFGSPVNPAGYRWGYGWPYGRNYKALSATERKRVRSRLQN